MRKLKVGLIGYGFSGEVFHAPFITSLDGLELSKVVSSNPDKVRKQLPNVEVIPHVEQLLGDESIDVVVITTPNTAHYPLAKQALLAGKHVVVEKPFVNQTKDAIELIELAASCNRLITVYHNRRWDNDYLTVKEIIQSGVLGEIVMFESHFDRFKPQVSQRWREQDISGSGILYDLGAHLIDQAMQLFGPPETIQGDLQVQRAEGAVDDYFHIVMGYGKLRVILHSSCMVLTPGPRFVIHGEKGSFIKHGMDSQEAALKAGNKPIGNEWGIDSEERYGELNIRVDESNKTSRVATIPGSYQSFYKALYHAIVDSKPVPVPAEEAMLTIKVIEAVKQSSLEKRTIHFIS